MVVPVQVGKIVPRSQRSLKKSLCAQGEIYPLDCSLAMVLNHPNNKTIAPAVAFPTELLVRAHCSRYHKPWLQKIQKQVEQEASSLLVTLIVLEGVMQAAGGKSSTVLFSHEILWAAMSTCQVRCAHCAIVLSRLRG